MKERKEILAEDRWNVEALYPSFKEWEDEFSEIDGTTARPRWPGIAAYKGSLQYGPEQLKKALIHILTIDRKITKLYTYAHLRHDEDLSATAPKEAYERILGIHNDFQQETAWFSPEIFSLEEETLKSYLDNPIMSDYKFYVEKIIRMRKHTLSGEIEEVITLANQPLQAAQKTFSAINNIDFDFGKVLDEKGKEKELTHALYSLYLRDHDRTLRKNAFQHYHGQYLQYENTMAELIAGNVQSHVFEMRVRRYASCLDAALFPKNVSSAVYHNLIKTVNENLRPLQR